MPAKQKDVEKQAQPTVEYIMKDLGPLSNRKMAEKVLGKQDPKLQNDCRESLKQAQAEIKKNFPQFGWTSRVEIEFRKLLAQDVVLSEFLSDPGFFASLTRSAGTELYNLLKTLNEEEDARDILLKNKAGVMSLLQTDSSLTVYCLQNWWLKEFIVNAKQVGFGVLSDSFKKKNPKQELETLVYEYQQGREIERKD